MKPGHRQEAVIEFAKTSNWREGDGYMPHNTVWIGLDFGGSHQSFGGLSLPDKNALDGFIQLACMTFGVKSLEELRGKRCFALRSFSNYNAIIHGLESTETGRRFTVNTFRALMGYPYQPVIREETERVKGNIARAEREANDGRVRLANIELDYVEWDALAGDAVQP